MPLIFCADCGTRHLDTAEACPNCGCLTSVTRARLAEHERLKAERSARPLIAATNARLEPRQATAPVTERRLGARTQRVALLVVGGAIVVAIASALLSRARFGSTQAPPEDVPRTKAESLMARAKAAENGTGPNDEASQQFRSCMAQAARSTPAADRNAETGMRAAADCSR